MHRTPKPGFEARPFVAGRGLEVVALGSAALWSRALLLGDVLGNRKRVIKREWWSRARQEEARIRNILLQPLPSPGRPPR